jgi:hypothetical protein
MASGGGSYAPPAQPIPYDQLGSYGGGGAKHKGRGSMSGGDNMSTMPAPAPAPEAAPEAAPAPAAPAPEAAPAPAPTTPSTTPDTTTPH